MSRAIAIAAALAAALTLDACASQSATKYSVTPQTQVVVRGANKKPTQANFRKTPEESMRTGAGGGGSEK
jgi:PBP1b-binding outer membrane lipoprotein LpoB